CQCCIKIGESQCIFTHFCTNLTTSRKRPCCLRVRAKGLRKSGLSICGRTQVPLCISEADQRVHVSRMLAQSLHLKIFGRRVITFRQAYVRESGQRTSA